jgi:hypothetical protein
MSEALTFLHRRRKSDVDLAATQALPQCAGTVFPSYFGIFGIFSERFPCVAGAVSPKHLRRFAAQFPSVRAFVAIV